MYTSSEVIHTGGHLPLRKKRFSAITGLANAAKSFRTIVLECWARELTYEFPGDMKVFQDLGKAIGLNASVATRRLHCLDTFKIYQAPAGALEGFGNLEELAISGHSDIDFGCPMSGLDFPTAASDTNQDQALSEHEAHPEATPQRMSYRKLKVRFPETLRVLKIYDNHAPDIYFIDKVANECPNLQSLTLARCTMFTRLNCEFWARLPSSESDSYFSNYGVETYAVGTF
ncbi:hypothetical protein RhiJN_01302 [Ceratobasidium sp. AG-Ba]|nr:hypothetical protein RhiJN_01302 [Ceratobasidium sp. AG-Ba]QRW02328.1 hypothetical protein RhiLY_01326 [Ceratobasidium sp. AG-Ba]